eukprot:gene9100-1194_t
MTKKNDWYDNPNMINKVLQFISSELKDYDECYICTTQLIYDKQTQCKQIVYLTTHNEDVIQTIFELVCVKFKHDFQHIKKYSNIHTFTIDCIGDVNTIVKINFVFVDDL